jgi:hypothetical protein
MGVDGPVPHVVHIHRMRSCSCAGLTVRRTGIHLKEEPPRTVQHLRVTHHPTADALPPIDPLGSVRVSTREPFPVCRFYSLTFTYIYSFLQLDHVCTYGLAYVREVHQRVIKWRRIHGRHLEMRSCSGQIRRHSTLKSAHLTPGHLSV